MVEIVAVLNSRPPVEAISDVHSQVAISLSNILTTKSNVLIPHQECLKNSICTAARSGRYSTSPICSGQDGERVPGTATNQSQVEGCIKKLSDWKCNFIMR